MRTARSVVVARRRDRSVCAVRADGARGPGPERRDPRRRARPGAADARSPRVALGGDLPDHRLGDREPPLPAAATGSSCPGSPSRGRRRRDGRSVTFKLRRDVKFHDGTPFNADAVKFNFDRIVDPNFKAGRRPRPRWPATRVEGHRRVHRTGNFQAPYAPFLTYAAGARWPCLAQGGAGDGRPGPHPAGRHRAVHGQGVRRQGPHDDGPEPGLRAEGAVE